MSLFLNFFSNEIAIQTSICLQNLASIQPRTSLVKFARSPRTDHYRSPRCDEHNGCHALHSVHWSRHRRSCEDLEDEVDSARQSQNGNALPPEAEDTEASLLAREEILAVCDYGALRPSD